MHALGQLKLQSKRLVLNVLHYFTQEAENGGPVTSVAAIQQRTAEACNINVRTLERLLNSDQNSLSGPKKRDRTKPKTEDLDESIKMEVRNLIYNLCSKNIRISLKLLQNELRNREILHISLPTLSKLLKTIVGLNSRQNVTGVFCVSSPTLFS